MAKAFLWRPKGSSLYHHGQVKNRIVFRDRDYRNLFLAKLKSLQSLIHVTHLLKTMAIEVSVLNRGSSWGAMMH